MFRSQPEEKAAEGEKQNNGGQGGGTEVERSDSEGTSDMQPHLGAGSCFYAGQGCVHVPGLYGENFVYFPFRTVSMSSESSWQ